MTPSESIPIKTDIYLTAESIFFTQFNKVEFYFEDTDQEELYYCILKKLFPNITFNKIFPLNGKKQVIGHAKQFGTSGYKIYIVDKDFDDLHGNIVNLPFLFYLDRYSIENYTLEDRAVLALTIGERPAVNRNSFNNKFNLTRFRLKLTKDFSELFLYFFIVQKSLDHIPTNKKNVSLPDTAFLKNVSLSDTAFLKNSDPSETDEKKIKIYQERVRKILQRKINFNQQIKKYRPYFYDNENNISGKFIISILLKRLRKIFNIPCLSIDSATYKLCKNCNFTSLKPLKKRIRTYLDLK